MMACHFSDPDPMPYDLEIEQLTKNFGSFKAVDNISFQVERGSFFSILGPSGCGKTTLLRMIAGFEGPSQGKIKIRGNDMAGVAPNKRPVNLIFQHLALFPMMNVAENIGFGLARQRVNKTIISEKVNDMLARVELPGYGDKKIEQLSGGQKQRVAIARSLILDPAVLLLDEPLGALDLKLRDQMKLELKKLQEKIGTTFIYITHDQSEALVMSDNVAVMNQGHFEQIGSPQKLYGDPATPFVAKFVGNTNVLQGKLIHDEDGTSCFQHDTGSVFKLDLSHTIPEGVPCEYLVRPESIIINPNKDSISELNNMQITINSLLFDGANSRLLGVTVNGEELLISLPQTRMHDNIKQGDTIQIGWTAKAGKCFRI